MTRPKWLDDHIRTNQRRATATTCRRCGRPVMVGLDDDVMAATVTIDLEPVDELREVAAHLVGDGSWTLAEVPGGFEIDRRDYWQIRARPARQKPLTYLRHTCQSGNGFLLQLSGEQLMWDLEPDHRDNCRCNSCK